MSAGFLEEWRSDGVEKSRPANLSMQPVYYEWLYQSVCNLISWDIILCRRNNFRVVVYQGSTRKLVKCAPTIVVYVKDENVTSTHSLRTRTKKISNKFIAMMCVRCCKRTIILETASIYVSHFNYAHMEYYHFSLVYFFFFVAIFFFYYSDLWISVALYAGNMIYLKWKTIYEDNKRWTEQQQQKLRHSSRFDPTKVNQANNE